MAVAKVEVDESDVWPTFGDQFLGFCGSRDRASHCCSFDLKERLHQLANIRQILDQKDVQARETKIVVRWRQV